MVMQWGQFLDHDIDHSMEAISRETFENGITCSSTCDYSTPCFPIEIPDDDNRYVTCLQRPVRTLSLDISYHISESTLSAVWSSRGRVQPADLDPRPCFSTSFNRESRSTSSLLTLTLHRCKCHLHTLKYAINTTYFQILFCRCMVVRKILPRLYAI